MWACDFGRTAVVEFLVDKGADLGAQNQDGQTGLHVAALAGHLDTVKSLLNRHAPLEIENVWGGTVLSHVLWAAINHDPNVDYAPIVEALIRAGCNRRTRNPGLVAPPDPPVPLVKTPHRSAPTSPLRSLTPRQRSTFPSSLFLLLCASSAFSVPLVEQNSNVQSESGPPPRCRNPPAPQSFVDDWSAVESCAAPGRRESARQSRARAATAAAPLRPCSA